jgi:hypothetical protein
MVGANPDTRHLLGSGRLCPDGLWTIHRKPSAASLTEALRQNHGGAGSANSKASINEVSSLTPEIKVEGDDNR